MASKVQPFVGKLIGLTGLAGSGKDTAADILVAHGWVKIALADPMKRAAAEWWGFTAEELWGSSEQRSREREVRPQVFLTARLVLQRLGTEVGRMIDEDVWVDLALRSTEELLCQPPPTGPRDPNCAGSWYDPTRGVVYGGSPLAGACRGVVISDVRFPNEARAIRAAGGRIVKLDGRGGLAGTAAAHASESGIPPELIDVVIDNSGTREALTMVIERLVFEKAV